MSAREIDFTAFTSELLNHVRSSQLLISSSLVIPIAFTVIDGLAVILTLFRLLFRLQIRRFWWEDVWATVAVVCGTIFIIVQLICGVTGKTIRCFHFNHTH